jgi:TRAP-type uncharacterized transport system fused permease subunit
LGSVGDILLTVTSALLGTVFLSVAFVGYLLNRLSVFKRVWFAVGACGLIAPKLTGSILGLLLIVLLLFWELRKSGYLHLRQRKKPDPFQP